MSIVWRLWMSQKFSKEQAVNWGIPLANMSDTVTLDQQVDCIPHTHIQTSNYFKARGQWCEHLFCLYPNTVKEYPEITSSLYRRVYYTATYVMRWIIASCRRWSMSFSYNVKTWHFQICPVLSVSVVLEKCWCLSAYRSTDYESMWMIPHYLL